MVGKIVKMNLSDQIVDTIIKQITGGFWKLGEKIPKEVDLAVLFNVSRNITREALKVLETNQILISKVGVGTFVSQNALKNIRFMEFLEHLRNDRDFTALFDTRLMIEPQLAYYAALRHTEEDIKVIDIYLDKAHQVIENMDETIPDDFPCHMAIANMSKNITLSNLLYSILDHLKETNYGNVSMHFHREALRSSAKDHVMILNAIKQGDAEKARTVMEKHLEHRFNTIQDSLAGLEENNLSLK